MKNKNNSNKASISIKNNDSIIEFPKEKQVNPIRKPVHVINPKIKHAAKMLGIEPLLSSNIEDIRVMYEGEDPCKVYIRVKNSNRFIMIREMPLMEFSFFAGYLGFGDVDRFETGYDAVNVAPVLIDPYFGRVVTVCLDIPLDMISIISETNNYQDSFSEWHETLLRSDLLAKDTQGNSTNSAFMEFLRNLQNYNEEDDF